MRILAALLLAGSLAAAETTLTGTVLDSEGKPVAGVDIGANWRIGTKMYPYEGVKTAADGTFSIKVSMGSGFSGLVAADAERKRGAAVTIAKADVEKPVTLTLVSLVKVSGSLSSDPSVDLSGAALTWVLGGAAIGNSWTKGPKWTVLLPPGKFYVAAIHGDTKGVRKEFEVPAGKDEFDLGDIPLPAKPVVMLAGKELPEWKVSDARGAEKAVQPKDYRGKWVLIEFWGSWCGSCVGTSLPRLTKFYEDHKDQRDRFEILAFHDASAKTFEVLDEKLKPIIQKYWSGKPLPFPILLDASGDTLKKLGIEEFPTLLLIDPDGKVVKGDAEKLLAARLAEPAKGAPDPPK